MPEQTCFVVMGFGKKTDWPTGRLIDLDKTYRDIIKPAAEAAGLFCTRADEVMHSGVIDVPMYDQLLKADVVIADISTLNANALYELGIRHALRPFTTITVAESQLKYPFDVNHVVIRTYRHLGEGIDYEEVMRFRAELSQAMQSILERETPDSPVYVHLRDLIPPSLSSAAGVPSAEGREPVGEGPSIRELTEPAEAAIASNNFPVAKALFSAVHALRPQDLYVVQRLALATYKAELPTPLEALHEARELLTLLDPQVSNDPETLGIWGGVHKRLWEENGETDDLKEAICAYKRGFELRGDPYNGINLAYLLNVEAKVRERDEPAEAVADFVMARRVRRQVVESYEPHLDASTPEEQYWRLAILAEAYLGLDDRDNSAYWLKEARSLPVADWMYDTTDRQLQELEKLLTPSPLRFVHAP